MVSVSIMVGLPIDGLARCWQWGDRLDPRASPQFQFVAVPIVFDVDDVPVDAGDRPESLFQGRRIQAVEI